MTHRFRGLRADAWLGGVVALVVLVLAVTACGTSESPGGEPADATTPTSGEPADTAVVPAGCESAFVAGTSSVTCDGLVLELGIPEQCLTEPCGLIVDFHGRGGTAKGEEQLTNMQRLGTAAGYVVVQPSSPGNAWWFDDATVRVRGILDAIIDAIDIDTSRVHVGGTSQGGFMTWHFVCAYADLIASAAPLAAGTGVVDGDSCPFNDERSPAEQVDILHFHGRQDTVVPFETGIAQRDRVVERWSMAESEIVADEPDYRWTRWTNERGTVMEFVEYDWTSSLTGGHCAPGVGGRGGCGEDTPIHYGEAALAFYIAHPKGN
jgi:dienelactone hydrolase